MKNSKNVALTTTIVLIAVMMLMLLKSTISVRREAKELERKIQIEQSKVDDKQQELQSINEELKEMDTPEYIRKIASKELGMVDENTQVFVIETSEPERKK